MNITAIRTPKILPRETTLVSLLETHLPPLTDKSIVVITSKIISMCEGRVVPKGQHDKSRLAAQEAERYLPPSSSRYDITLTINRNTLIPSAGIDESNGNGNYILWPKDPQTSANTIREFLTQHYPKYAIGVLITDSKTTPLRWGTTGISIAHSGFSALNDVIGKPDIFGRKLTMTKVNVADALSAAAVVVMGESNEQTPLAVITDVPFVQFQHRNPTDSELQKLHIPIEDDVYAPLLTSVKWLKGKQHH